MWHTSSVRNGLALVVAGGLLSLNLPSGMAAPLVEPAKKSSDKKASPGQAQPKDEADDPIKQNEQDIQRALREVQKQVREMQAQLQRQLQLQQRQIGAPIPGVPNVRMRVRVNGLNGLPFGGQQESERLGAVLDKPSGVLVDQLNLPADQGMVIHEVQPNSAAAKAGLKNHDILLEMNGKPVPSDPTAFEKMMAELKAKTPIDAVVMRKGKKETVKGVTLPEPNPNGNRNPWRGGGFKIAPGQIMPVLPVLPGLPGAGGFGGGFGGIGGAAAGGFGAVANPNVRTTSISVERKPDGTFTTRYKEGSIAFQIKGKSADGKTTVDEIQIKDGNDTKTYKSIEDVPESFRDDVKFLLRRGDKK